MMSRSILHSLLVLPLLSLASGYGQNLYLAPPASAPAIARMETRGEREGPDHDMYKKGYDMVLDEKWDAARKQFADLLAKYPKSTYAEDARYWSAYALMHTDLNKALMTYTEFVDKYPRSSYYDDAVADLQNIKVQIELARANGTLDSLQRNSRIIVPSTGFAPKIYGVESRMRTLDRRMRWMDRHLGRMMMYPTGPVSVLSLTNGTKLDEKTRLKLDALRALGENTNDEKAFATLKGVAMDPKQPVILRKEALDLLSEFKNQDVDAIYLDLVRKDTSQEIQVIAIENIGQSKQNKEKALQYLEQLYGSLPAHHEEQRAAALYRIADIGNDQAVDFLAKVAKTDSDYDLRSDAVYYLGNIGGDRARTVLYDILKAD
jgi:tetratricopeptide (TPR) repeat protein